MKNLRNNKGFTFAELLVAMVILIIGSLGITNLTVSIIRGNSSNYKITTATLLAQNQVQ
ncbi:MAG: type IV pilus modification PilV family protein, partial [Nitrososphaera sp.]